MTDANAHSAFVDTFGGSVWAAAAELTAAEKGYTPEELRVTSVNLCA